MRILYVSPSNAVGGAEMSLLQMAKYLHQKGHTVFVAMPPLADKTYEQLLKPFVEGFLFVPLMAWNRLPGLGFFAEMKGWMYRFYKSRGGWFNAPFRIARFVRRHNIELIHTNTIMALDGAIAAKIAGVPHIQHLREITGYGQGTLFPMLGQARPKTFNKLMGWLHKVLIANSKFVARASATLYPLKKIKLAYNLFDEHFFLDRTDDRTRKMVFNIGLVANVTAKWKNHAMFINLASMILKEASTLPLTFSFYGKIPNQKDIYFQGLQNQIIEAQIQDHITFQGLIEQKKMYKALDILFHATPHEFFGRIFIEAMAEGVPVVAARGGGADELIQDGENGFLFDAHDLESAARKVKVLCEDRQIYDRIAKNGLAFARQFRSEVTGAALLDVYREILP